MKLTIIILNWNSADRTLACVTLLSTWQKICPEIIVVDNASNETDTQKLESTSLAFHLIKNPYNLGYAGGNNAGIKRALELKRDVVALMNSDAEIDETDMQLLLATLDDKPDVSAVGPALYNESRSQIINAGGLDIGWNYFTHTKAPAHINQCYDVAYISGTLALFRADLFESVGFLNEKYFFSGEIADFCRRIKQQLPEKRLVINPQAKAVHTLADSGHRATLYSYYTVRNRYLYVKSNLKWQSTFLIPYWIVRHCYDALRSWCIGQKDNSRFVLRGVKDGILGRYGELRI